MTANNISLVISAAAFLVNAFVLGMHAVNERDSVSRFRLWTGTTLLCVAAGIALAVTRMPE